MTTRASNDDLDQSILELFRIEAENQGKVLTSGLLALESKPSEVALLTELMRAAHSLKGAARIVNLNAAVKVAHAMEDCFVAAQKGKFVMDKGRIDILFQALDLLNRIAQEREVGFEVWENERQAEVQKSIQDVRNLLEPGPVQPQAGAETPASMAVVPVEAAPAPPPAIAPPSTTVLEPEEAPPEVVLGERVLRVTADNLNRLLGLAGESLVEARRLGPFSKSLVRLKRLQGELERSLELLAQTLDESVRNTQAQVLTARARQQVTACRQFLTDRVVDLDIFDRRWANLSDRLYNEALNCRMRPFMDGVESFPRMVRDLARDLGKEARLEILGKAVPVDRDLLEQMKAPLTHLLRNAVDHGLFAPEQRAAIGKPRAGVIQLEARHSAGTLVISVTDDGEGIDLERLRLAVVQKGMATVDTASRLSESELYDFLFLPGFSLKEKVSEISGRGVGLDIVQTMTRRVRGALRVSSEKGIGSRFQLQLPLSLSVVRALLVEISGEPYGFPLAHLRRTMLLDKNKLDWVEGRPHVALEGSRIGLISARQLLGKTTGAPPGDTLSVVVLGQEQELYGVVIDKFLGERELVVQPLDPLLGVIKDVSAGALMEDGSPLLMLDVEDLITSIRKASSATTLERLAQDSGHGKAVTKRILVVDDSLTVRELERKLLESRGYLVEIAVDGLDGWNAVRSGHYNLLISDVDMPRMDGIELVSLVKKDPRLKDLPVMIVSYKDRDEDKKRGLEAGADYYLGKGSFKDESLIHAVMDLIGAPDA